MIRGFFNFLLFSSIYIAFCALAMAWQTEEILQLKLDRFNFAGFAFFSTICSYNFHWYLTPGSIRHSERILWGQRRRTLQLIGCGIGLLGSLWFFGKLYQHWLPIGGAVVLTFLYSAPKVPHRTFRWLSRIAVGKTIFLAFVWMYVTTLLPAFMSDVMLADWWDLAFLAAHRFFLIYAICILFDYRDREEDRQQGIRSLITMLPERQLDNLYYISLFIAAAAALALAPAVPLYVVFSLLAPVAVTSLVKSYSQRNTSDYVYYFFLDGLMMLSALLHLGWLSAGGI